MKAFWWYQDHSIAGMARPGFNRAHWFDCPFDEALILGWVGQLSTGTHSIREFHRHLYSYGQKIAGFYKLSPAAFGEIADRLLSPDGFQATLRRLDQRLQLLEGFTLNEDELKIHFCQKRLQYELDFLKSQKMDHVVCLTEKHHAAEHLEGHFEFTHLSITDLEAPRREQVELLANVIQKCREQNERLVIHCLAGIGRTSTMIIAAHLLMGHEFAPLLARIMERNPTFVLAGSQKQFLENLARPET